MTFAPLNSNSTYLPGEFELPQGELLRDFISKRERLTASIINIKENANYQKIELMSGQQWFVLTSAATASNQIPRYGFRVTADLVALNGGPIGAGSTNIVLNASTQPSSILGSLYPLPSHGSATSASGVYLFLNDPQVYVRFTPSTQTISITNSFGSNLTQCYYVFEYLKQ